MTPAPVIAVARGTSTVVTKCDATAQVGQQDLPQALSAMTLGTPRASETTGMLTAAAMTHIPKLERMRRHPCSCGVQGQRTGRQHKPRDAAPQRCAPARPPQMPESVSVASDTEPDYDAPPQLEPSPIRTPAPRQEYCGGAMIDLLPPKKFIPSMLPGITGVRCISDAATHPSP